jgi:arginine exporter protein ArgO
MNFSVYLTGLTMGLSLIVAIGAQNAFVLRQGLRDEHVFAVSLVCAVSDAVLITLGITSFQKIAAALPAIDPIMRYGGAAFLIWCAEPLFGNHLVHGAFDRQWRRDGLMEGHCYLPRSHMAQSACLSGHGCSARHHIHPVSGS